LKKIEFNEAFMGAGEPLKGSRIPGFGAGNRTPQTSRVHRSRAMGKVPAKSVRKGLARSCVSVRWLNDRMAEVRVKGTLHILGHIRVSKGASGKAYSYKLVSEQRSHNGFASQKAAVDRMLEKC
jgi:hypothetical protein